MVAPGCSPVGSSLYFFSDSLPMTQDARPSSASAAPVVIQPVIMAGGSGTRLWPLSRAGYPKQFLVLGDSNRSLFQEAAARLAALAGPERTLVAPLIVGNEEHRFLVLDQLRELRQEPAAVLLEPVGRNTAPALTLAALQALEGGQDPVLVVTPADQTVTDEAAFTAALGQAIEQAAQGRIVILGITPTAPETGYGYIRSEPETGARRVAQFVEKPDLATAERYLADGGYCWNSGMFVLRASVWMQALQTFRPDIAAAVQAAWAPRQCDARFVRPGKAEFAAVPSESVDYAVMERCPGSAFDIRMVALDAGWNDLGAWDAVWQVARKDAHGNASVGDVITQDSRDTLVHSSGRLVSVVGVDNLVVVETADAVMVADRSRSQDVKKIVASLEKGGRTEHTLHRKVHRPWGWYDSIDAGPRFQVKRIMVKPGASLSLQMHHHRAEHWIVVTGTAEITNGDKVLLLSENQSTYIPLGEVHRLANPGKVPLEIIEVQSGSYLGEDDIVRYEDTYGRN
jgi:mannose-1-phosphate guanylyltransferase/mannose-6-phosphate isomerase